MDHIKQIDIGCGNLLEAGWEPWDIKQGRHAEQLDGIADGQLDAIRASHVLEHISYTKTVAVLQEWARALRTGGELQVAVPDFDKLVAAYVNGPSEQVEPVLMGGHTDEHDHHQAIFNRQKLVESLGVAGFDVVGEWTTDISGHCARHPCSLNLRAVKVGTVRLPLQHMTDTCVLMSMPRLAWTGNFECVNDACYRLRMPQIVSTGVFWGQCLQRAIEDAAKDGRFKYVLTVDYDTVFTPHDVVLLRHLLDANGLDGLAALQQARDRADILTMIDDGNGKPLVSLSQQALRQPHWPCLSAHFGLTLFKLDALQRVPRPLFLGVPCEDGSWGDGRVDDDIYFWHKARANGLKVSVTPQVVVGHMQVVCTWPNEQLQPEHQYVKDYKKNGRRMWEL